MASGRLLTGSELDEFTGGDTMSRSDYLEGTAWEQGEQTQWSPTVKLILAFILGLLALSPATLGFHWEMILANW